MPSAGSIFRIPVVPALDPEVFLAASEQRKIPLFALMPKNAIEVAKADFSRKCAIIVGSEGRGVSELLGEKSTRVRIPTVGVESLNAALAAGIALFVARTQRMAAG